MEEDALKPTKRFFGWIAVGIGGIPAIGLGLVADGVEALANLATGRPQKMRATPAVLDALGNLLTGNF